MCLTGFQVCGRPQLCRNIGVAALAEPQLLPKFELEAHMKICFRLQAMHSNGTLKFSLSTYI